MTLQDFIYESKMEIGSYFESAGIKGICLGDREYVKSNDTQMHAITVSREGSGIAGNVYVDDLFELYESGHDKEELMDELRKRCESAVRFCPPRSMIDVSGFKMDKIRNRLTLKLLDSRSNRSYMRDRPYIDAGNGLVLMVQINSEENIRSEWCISMTNSLLEDTGCSKEELLTEAMSNTIRLEPPLLMELRDMLMTGTHTNLLENGGKSKNGGFLVYVLTNQSSFKGASVLFYPGVMEKVAEVIGAGYYVLPSSIHELILIPEHMGISVTDMYDMLHNGNAGYVEREEFLSDRVFFYDADEKTLKVAGTECAAGCHAGNKGSRYMPS